MKCPFCGTNGAQVNADLFAPGASIHSAIDCSNPKCPCFKTTDSIKLNKQAYRNNLANVGRDKPSRFSDMILKFQKRILNTKSGQNIRR